MIRNIFKNMNTNNFQRDFLKHLNDAEEVIHDSLGIKINFTSSSTIERIEKNDFIESYTPLKNTNDARDSLLFVDVSLSVGDRNIKYTAKYYADQNLELSLQAKPIIEMDYFPNEVDKNGNIWNDSIPKIKTREEMVTSLLGVVIETSLQFT